MNFSSSFQAALNAFNNKDLDYAQQMCELLLKQRENADVFHLLALINKAKNQPDKSVFCFESALKISANNPKIHGNYANLLASLNEQKSAKSHYTQALKLDKNFVDAKVNLALLLSKERNLAEASALIDNIVIPESNSLWLLKIKAKIFQNCLDFKGALELFETCLKQDPTDYFCLINYVCVLRELEMREQALSVLKEMAINQPRNSEVSCLIGCIYFDLFDYKKSELFLKQALEYSPENIPAHEALNKLYWEQGQQTLFLQSYNLLNNTPLSPKICYSKIAQQIQACQYENAQDELNTLPKSIANEAGFIHLQAIIADRFGDDSKANDFYSKAAHAEPNNLRFQIDFANVLIKKTEYLQALSILDSLEKQYFFNQELWAYRGICWRLLDNPKHDWLNNYDQFIQPIDLGYPEGYDSQAHFLKELSETLNNLHTSIHQPLDQSVRNGTQTLGNLLNKNIDIIQQYKRLLTNATQKYLALLPQDPTHPLLSRNRGKFTFEGSWSVKLGSGGFHSNHVHPLGWISGPSYITVPKEIHSHDPTKAGWVKFGETALTLGEKEHIGRIICPEAGKVVLFPSYMWHGTQPFMSSDIRLTAPVDISPR